MFDEVEDVYYKHYYDIDFEDSSSEDEDSSSDDEGSSNKSGDVQCMKSVESSDVSVVYVTTKKSSVIKESEKAVWESSEYSNQSDSSLSAKLPSPSPSSSLVSIVDTELPPSPSSHSSFASTDLIVDTLIPTQKTPEDEILDYDDDRCSEDDCSDAANTLVGLKVAKRKRETKPWIGPIATFDNWTDALSGINLVEPCD